MTLSTAKNQIFATNPIKVSIKHMLLNISDKMDHGVRIQLSI